VDLTKWQSAYAAVAIEAIKICLVYGPHSSRLVAFAQLLSHYLGSDSHCHVSGSLAPVKLPLFADVCLKRKAAVLITNRVE